MSQRTLEEVRQQLNRLSNVCQIAASDMNKYMEALVPGKIGVQQPIDPAMVPRRAEYLQVSDTILIRPLPGAIDPLSDLVKTCLMVLQIGIMMGIRLRGAIVKGNYEWQVSPPIVFGPALVRAMTLEGRQDWYGGILDLESIPIEEIQVAKLLENELVIWYKVPMKEGLANQQLALSWPRRLISDFSDLLEPKANEWTALRKELNSKAFYDHVRALFPLGQKTPAL